MPNYSNPNDLWRGYDPYKGMTDQERMQAGCLQSVIYLAVIIIAMLLCALFGSCTTTRYVPVNVPEIHEHWQHTTDTILKTDSIIDRQVTTIREVDSATMARYGIQMSALQTAWLIQTDRLQRELSELRQTKTDTTVIHDSIPVPYPVEKEVPAPLTGWQQLRLHLGDIALFTIAIIFLLWLWKSK